MKRRKTWKRIVAIVMAVVMLPFSSLENCFVSTAYAADASFVSDALENVGVQDGEEAITLETADETTEESQNGVVNNDGLNDSDPKNAESIETSISGTDGSEMDEAGTDKSGTDDTETSETETDEAGSDDTETSEAGTDKLGTGDAGTHEAETNIAETDTSGDQADDVEFAIELSAELDDHGSIQLNWALKAPSIDGQYSYVIYKNDQVLDTVATENEQALHYEDTDIIASATYSYRIERAKEAADQEAESYKSDYVYVKIPNALNIENDYITIDEDMEVLDLNMTGGSLTIEEGHKLIVKRNASLTYGDIYNYGELYCNGNFEATGSYVYMYYGQDAYWFVGEDITMEQGTMELSRGSARFNGNCTLNCNIYNYDSFQVVFGGDSRQNIFIRKDEYYDFPRIEIQNTSQEGINFQSTFRSYEMSMNNANVFFCENKAVGDWILTEDSVYEGDLLLIGTLNLNGYSLTIEGDLIQPMGSVVLSGGKLNIQGDYLMRNPEADNLKDASSYGKLVMENECDELIVNGDLSICREYGEYNENLYDGRIEVKGNVLLSSPQENTEVIRTNEGLKLILSGDKKQEILSQNGAYANFAELVLTNNSEEGIVFHDNVFVNEEIDDQSRHVEGVLFLDGNIRGHFTGDAIISDWCSISDELQIDGDLTIRGDLNLYGAIRVNGNVTMERGSIYMSEDALLLAGKDFYFTPQYTSTNLNAGTIECKGNLYTNGKFVASGKHRIVLSGSKMQMISTEITDRFAIVELRNTSNDGVQSDRIFSYLQLIKNDSKFEYTQAALDRDWRLTEDQVWEGDLVWSEGLLNLTGFKLHVTGSLIHEGGVIDLNNGQLIVDGDYRIQKKVADEEGCMTGNGLLRMEDENDRLVVGGSFLIDTTVREEKQFSNGVIEVKGDVDIKTADCAQAFAPTGSSKMILSGSEKQQISIENSDSDSSFFNHLIIANSSEAGVVFVDKIYAKGNVEDQSKNLKGDLALDYNATLIDDYFSGNLWFSSRINSQNLKVDGDLHINYAYSSSMNNCYVGGDFYCASSLSLKGTLNVGGNCYINSGYIDLAEGALNIEGDLIIPDGKAYLKMTHEKDRVCVKGNAILNPSEKYRYYNPDYLTAGTMEIHGDLILGKGFKATENFVLVLSGSSKQTIQTANNQYVYLGSIIVNNQSNEGVEFDIADAYYLQFKRLSNQNSKLVIAGKNYSENSTILKNYTVRQDEMMEGNVFVLGSLCINSCRLEVTGDLFMESSVEIYSGELVVGGELLQSAGKLELRSASKASINGDYRLQNRTKNGDDFVYDSSTGYLYMEGANDRVLVKGSFISSTTYQPGYSSNLRGGLLEVQGDFIIDDTVKKTFVPAYGFIVKLSGGEKQEVDLGEEGQENNFFTGLILANSSEEGVIFRRMAYVKESVTDETKRITGWIRVTDATAIKTDYFSGSIVLGGMINNPLTIAGDLSVNEGEYLRVYNNVTVEGDVVAKGDIYIYESVEVMVGGNVSFENEGYLSNSGMLVVDGDFRVDTSGNQSVSMSSTKGYVLVKGDVYFKAMTCYLNYGIWEIWGDFTAVSGWNPKDSFRIIFSGEQKQRVFLEEGQKFNIVELKNFSEDGIELNNVSVSSLVIQWENCRFTGDDVNGEYEIRTVLMQDQIIEGDYLLNGNIDLNGHTVSVKGDLIHRYGTVLFNGGRLYVEGDYIVKDTADEPIYPNGSSYGLQMKSEEDKLLVMGNMQISETDKKFTWTFTNGTLEVKGDIALDRKTSLFGLYTTSNRTLVLSGNELQTITSKVKNYFKNIVIYNENVEGVCFEKNISVYGNFESNGHHVEGELGIASAGVSFGEYPFNGNILLDANISLKKDLSIVGDLRTNGKSLEISGGTLNVGGDLNVDYSGGLYIREASVVVEGNLTIQGGFEMTNANSRLTVEGNFLASPKSSNVKDGLLVVEGDFETKSTFCATNEHMVEFAGNHKQVVTMQSGTCLRHMRLNNSSPEGVFFNSIFVSGTMDFGNSVYTMGEEAGIYGYTLTEDETYDGDMPFSGGILDLNGHTLIINGNLIQKAGLIRLNGGSLIITGNYRQYYEAAILEMGNTEDRMVVGGNFSYTCGTKICESITGGTLEVKGNMDLGSSSTNYYLWNMSATTLVLSGERDQKINIYGGATIENVINRCAAKLTISSQSGKIISVTGNLIDEIQRNNILGSTIRIQTDDQIMDGIWGGSVEFGKSLHLSKDLKLRSLSQSVTGVTVSVGEHQVDAQSVSISNGALDLQKGTISCEISFGLSSKGKLYMQDEEGRIIVGTRFSTTTSDVGILSAGTIEVYGDFYESGQKAFVTSGTHTVIFPEPKNSEAGKQNITFYDTTGTSKFNNLILERAAEDYVFSQSVDNIAVNVKFEKRDFKAPESISNLEAAAVNSTYVTIRFSEAVDENGIGGYRIERDGTIIATVTSTEYKDTGLTPDTEYTYKVYPFDKNFNYCEESPELRVRTSKDLNAPSVPRLSVKSRTGSSIMLEWTKASDDIGVVGYNLYRNNVKIAEGLTKTSFKDAGLSLHTVYRYQVEAYDQAGNVSQRSAAVETSVVMPEFSDIQPQQGARIGGDSVRFIIHYSAPNDSDRIKIEYLTDAQEWKVLTSYLYGDSLTNVSGTNRYVASYTWNLSGLAGDRDYQVRFTLTDADGNYVTEQRTYHLDRLAPKAPQELDAVAKDGTVILEWEPSVSADCVGYKLYKKHGDTGAYILITDISGASMIYYEDSDVIPGEDYSYALRAYDDFGNLGEMSETVDVTVDNDEEAPRVTSITPKDKRICGIVNLNIKATDNRKVKSIILQYREESQENWTDLAKVTYRDMGTCCFDTTKLPDGVYLISAVAKDSSGNESAQRFTKRFEIDNTGVEKIVIKECNAISTSISISWEDVSDEDFSYFTVEQLVNGSYKEIARVSDKLGYIVTGLTPLTSYSFRVAGVDTLGNKGEYCDVVTCKTTEDEIRPVITRISPASTDVKNKLQLSVYATDNAELGDAVISVSTDGAEFIQMATLKPSSVTKSYRYDYELDVHEMAEGDLYVRFEVYDKAGNKNALTQNQEDIIVKYTIDRTAPSRIQNVTSNNRDGYIEITWDVPENEGIAEFVISRANAKNRVFSVLDDHYTNINYYDANLQPGETYIYKVAAIDRAGNRGEFSLEYAFTVEEDKQAPAITGLAPDEGVELGLNARIQALAIDNLHTKKLVLEYRKASDTESDWNTIAEVSDQNRQEIYADVIWNNKDLENGEYEIRAIAEDAYGNVGEPLIRTYQLNMEEPKRPDLKVTNSHYRIELEYGVEDESQVECYEVQRKMVGNGNFERICYTEETTYADTNINVNAVYIYRVGVYYKNGTLVWSEEQEGFGDDVDDTDPIAVLPENLVGLVDMEMAFDGMGSSDNVRVTAYHWDMGDGTVLNGPQPIHAYAQAGTYTVTLKVEDAAGNSDETSMEVRIQEKSGHGSAIVDVIGSDGEKIPFAYIHVVENDGTELNLRTDSYGQVTIAGPVGKYSVSAYGNGYLPNDIEVLVLEYEPMQYKVILEKEELIVGKLTAKRLSIQEMKEAGVDFSNPENYNQVQFSMELSYKGCPNPIPIQMIGPRPATVELPDRRITAQMISSQRNDSAQQSSWNEEPLPIVVVQSVQGISWMKDMFQVELDILNAADAEYYIKDTTATLRLPEGVSLAKLQTSQSLVQDMGTVHGQEQRHAQWIVKGDMPGTKRLSADVTGTLMPFEAPVEAVFETDIEVYGGTGIKIFVYPEQHVVEGELTYVQFAIVNASNVPVYGFSTTIGKYRETPIVTYVYDVDEEEVIERNVKEIKIRDSNGLSQSIQVKDGQKLYIDTLQPGGVITGTLVRKVHAEGAEELQYYELIQQVVEMVSGQETGLEIHTEVVPGHVYVYRVSYEWQRMEEERLRREEEEARREEELRQRQEEERLRAEEEERLREEAESMGDPIDMNSGFFTDEVSLLSVTGASLLDISMRYNSGSSAFRGQLGFGWHHDYEKWLEQVNGIIYYHPTPMDTFCFRKDETWQDKGYMAGRMEGNTLILADGEEYSYGRYVPMSGEMTGTVMIRNTDGTYTLSYSDMREYSFTADGKLSRVNDGTGITISFTYYENEMVIRDDLSGKRLHVEYDGYHRVVKVKDDNGRQMLLAYEGDDLCSVTNPEGYVTRYTYDANHYIMSEANEEGVYVTNTYNDAGRVTRQTNPEGEAITLSYEKENGKLLITTTYPGNLVKKIQLTESGRIEWMIDSNGAKTEYYYDERGNRIVEQDALGHQILKEYDDNGNVIKIVDEGKNVSLMEYDSHSRLVAVTNADGNRSTFEYDEYGRPIRTVDMEGNEIRYEYNEHGQLIRQSQGALGETSFVYENGMLAESVDYLGNRTLYEYDGAGNLIKQTDALGNSTVTRFDKLGRVVAVTDAMGATTSYTYDCNNRVTSVTDALGNVARYEYDRVGHPTKVSYPDGTYELQEYDACGNLSAITYADGSRMLYEYDSVGNRIKETWPDGRTYTAEYDLLGNRVAEKDVNGNVVRYEYYPNGNLYRITHQDGTTELYTYNKQWKVAAYTDVTGATTSYAYDLMNRLTMERDALGGEMRYAYDALGRMTSRTDPNGNVTAYEYDANSNCTKIIDALGGETFMEYDALNRLTSLWRMNQAGEKISVSYTYDALGRVSTYTDELGRTSTMNYDMLGNLVSTTDPDGHVASVTEYDSRGRVSQVKDDGMLETACEYDVMGNLIRSVLYLNGEAKRTTQYEYDANGRLVKVTDPMDGVTKARYDERGNIASLTDPNGGETTYEYDNMGRLLAETNPVGAKYAYSYNAQGLLEELRNARGQKTEYDYDKLGRVVSVKDDLGEVKYAYDKNGNVLTVSDENGTIRRTYDALNRVTSYTDYNGKTVKYSYDELGNLIALTYPGGEIVRYAYYKNGLLYNATDPEGKVTTYEYDQRGNLTKTVRPNGTVEECTYNASGLLVEQVETVAATEGGEETELLHYRYTYDDYGNVKAVDGAKTLNTAEGISRLTSVRMTYDAANRLLTYNGEAVRYDADGNMVYGPVNGEMGVLTYDCRNRLVSAGGVTYGYDPENVRISAETDSYREVYVTESVSGSLSRVLVMTRYEKTDGADGNSAVPGAGVETIYVYGNGLISEKTGDRELWHHYNNLGSTVLLTDGAGKPVAEYTYGAYGELLSGDASLTRFLYNGRCGVSTDANGLYYMRQRYYNVDIRRFINQDIITGDLTNSQSLNRYCYVQGNPVKYTDPFGLSPEDGGNKGGNFWHSLLGFVGIIPGPIGAVANAVDAAIYFVEGNYAMGVMCALDALIPAAGALGTALAKTCKYARIGSTLATGAKVTNTVFNLSRGMYNADRAVGSFCERHKDDLFTDKFRWTKADTADLFGFGLSTLTCIASGKSLAKDLDDFMAASTDLATLGSSVGCFVAGTTVKTEEGDKAIEEIEVGDRVLAYEATTGRFAYKEVVDIVAHDGVTELAHVTVDGETIDSTTNHPYFVVGYGYVDAGNLIEGDTVLLANGKEAKVEKVEIEFLTEPVTVYNFEVKDWHCYFVGEAGVLVHNDELQLCNVVSSSSVGIGEDKPKSQNTLIAEQCNARATEINNLRGEWDSRNGTAAVMKAIDNKTGKEIYLVATNAPNTTMPKALQGVLRDNEVYIGGKGHAEQTIMNNIGDRYTIIAGGTSRNICKDICQPLLEADGLTLGGPKYSGRSDKSPFRQFWR